MRGAPSKRPSQDNQSLIIAFVLVVLTCAVYWPALRFGFTIVDDERYVHNYMVMHGVSGEAILWAISDVRAAYWHPVTWMSHILDARIFGPDNAQMFHLENVILHLGSGLLVFAFLRKTTGSLWASGMVSCFFLIHPIQVESVAWIAERKTLLCGFFWMLTLWFYACFVQHPTRVNHCLVAVSMAGALMAKPVAVTLPFVLLLLDIWPLRRLSFERLGALHSAKTDCSLRQLILEKLPLFCLSAGAVVITLAVSHYTHEIVSGASVPLATRIANGLVCVWEYVGKLAWPLHLAAFYPFPRRIETWKWVSSLVFVVLISGMVLLTAPKRPYLFTGWFWFLGTLIPTLGFIQEGIWPRLADRHVYLACIGVFLMVVWGIGEYLNEREVGAYPVLGLFSASAFAFVFLAHHQLGFWEYPVDLWRHTLQVTGPNAYAYANLAAAHAKQGDTDAAIETAKQGLEADPSSGKLHLLLGQALLTTGRTNEARIALERSVRASSDEAAATAWVLLADLANWRGDTNEAIRCCMSAEKCAPYDCDIAYVSGVALLTLERPSLAAEAFQNAIRVFPNHVRAHSMLAETLLRLGSPKEALDEARLGVALEPESSAAHNTLGFVLANTGALPQAVEAFETALRLNPENAAARQNLFQAETMLRQ